MRVSKIMKMVSYNPPNFIKSVPPGSPQNTSPASGMKIRGRSVLAHRPTKHRTQRAWSTGSPSCSPLPSYPTAPGIPPRDTWLGTESQQLHRAQGFEGRTGRFPRLVITHGLGMRAFPLRLLLQRGPTRMPVPGTTLNQPHQSLPVGLITRDTGYLEQTSCPEAKMRHFPGI